MDIYNQVGAIEARDLVAKIEAAARAPPPAAAPRPAVASTSAGGRHGGATAPPAYAPPPAYTPYAPNTAANNGYNAPRQARPVALPTRAVAPPNTSTSTQSQGQGRGQCQHVMFFLWLAPALPSKILILYWDTITVTDIYTVQLINVIGFALRIGL